MTVKDDAPAPNPAPSARSAEDEKQLKDDMLGTIPSLRAFAFSLCGNADRADDLVQETLMKAWINQTSFTQGTSMSAWLFTILRNVFYSEYRKRRREVEDAEGSMAARLVSVPEQNGHMDLQDLRAALQKLPAEQRGACPGGRIGLCLRRGRTNLRVCAGNPEEPGQSSTHGDRLAHGDRGIVRWRAARMARHGRPRQHAHVGAKLTLQSSAI